MLEENMIAEVIKMVERVATKIVKHLIRLTQRSSVQSEEPRRKIKLLRTGHQKDFVTALKAFSNSQTEGQSLYLYI